ncbi:hypothetical protein BKA70DRAFT_1541506 [Coprinopsis sp. MPI-PUGE-AT-0042]|nr:hypothetical protein BKA70DRAFT_1541506 [Coprinopsis sp. MPI-PUGE-AT-0042]
MSQLPPSPSLRAVGPLALLTLSLPFSPRLFIIQALIQLSKHSLGEVSAGLVLTGVVVIVPPVNEASSPHHAEPSILNRDRIQDQPITFNQLLARGYTPPPENENHGPFGRMMENTKRGIEEDGKKNRGMRPTSAGNRGPSPVQTLMNERARYFHRQDSKPLPGLTANFLDSLNALKPLYKSGIDYAPIMIVPNAPADAAIDLATVDGGAPSFSEYDIDVQNNHGNTGTD